MVRMQDWVAHPQIPASRPAGHAEETILSSRRISPSDAPWLLRLRRVRLPEPSLCHRPAAAAGHTCGAALVGDDEGAASSQSGFVGAPGLATPCVRCLQSATRAQNSSDRKLLPTANKPLLQTEQDKISSFNTRLISDTCLESVKIQRSYSYTWAGGVGALLVWASCCPGVDMNDRDSAASGARSWGRRHARLRRRRQLHTCT
jgi:hypothetical protein